MDDQQETALATARLALSQMYGHGMRNDAVDEEYEARALLDAIIAQLTDEKGRGPSYLRGFADGRMAEPAGVSSGELPRADHSDWESDLLHDPLVDHDALARWHAAPRLDRPPFAPELADAPLVTGESGAPAPLVVDHPVHESTLPDELAPGRYQYGGGANGLTLCDCGHPGVGHGAPESADGRGLAPDPCRLCGCPMYRAREGQRP